MERLISAIRAARTLADLLHHGRYQGDGKALAAIPRRQPELPKSPWRC
jgi:hypothetical protein